MHESWPAWGGSTSVGITRRFDVEKSRRRASGASNTISWGVVQAGARRSVAVASQRGTLNAPGPRSSVAAQILPMPSTALAQPSSQLSNRPEPRAAGEGTGGHCETALIFVLLGEKTSKHLRNGEAPVVFPTGASIKGGCPSELLEEAARGRGVRAGETAGHVVLCQ